VSRLASALAETRRRLLAERLPTGYWVGELSTSALSTATAIAALAEIDAARHGDAIRGGLVWLAEHANADGGWGDTVASRSNINTTTLCWAALNLAGRVGRGGAADLATAGDRAAAWLARRLGATGEIPPAALVRRILAGYGRDRTFSTPICSLAVLCGRLGDRRRAFRLVPALPFELAALPQRLFRWLRLPVVSYAIPALVAIGQGRAYHQPSRLLPLRWLRRFLRRTTLALVRRMQPAAGGFLEAPPLPSFVALNLAATGLRDHPIVREVVRFLTAVRRPDGSWPICTDLATWVTTLAVNALTAGRPVDAVFTASEQNAMVGWLLAQQHRVVHPFTGAAPGGWGWSDRSGAIADADDTAGVLLALRRLAPEDPAAAAAAAAGLGWLLDLQNRDGGIPTFCRGWNRLPFDRSAADISAHAVAAFTAWLPVSPPSLAARLRRALPRLVRYLARAQRPDGAWVPLWFGNQWQPADENPVYGTARVVAALIAADQPGTEDLWRRGLAYLQAAQRLDGGWGGDPTGSGVEETALAVDALAATLLAGRGGVAAGALRATVDRGVARLLDLTADGTGFPPAPIGFYFARLWYHERLYPVIFALQALERAACLPPAGAA
jgi:squalene-hopene/tetraprenyl-beta-curcumene cyclase